MYVNIISEGNSPRGKMMTEEKRFKSKVMTVVFVCALLLMMFSRESSKELSKRTYAIGQTIPR